MSEKNLSTNWIWTQDRKERIHQEPELLYFRKEYTHADKIKISANCRYKLYINGDFVQEGPQKGSRETAFVDTADLAAWEKPGKNAAAVEVLYYPENSGKRNDSLYYSPYPCLYVEGGELNGHEGWKYMYADHISLHKEPFDPAPICGVEKAEGAVLLKNWKHPGYKDQNWHRAQPYDFFEVNKPTAPFQLEERTIPLMHHEDGRFKEIVCIRSACSRMVQSEKEEQDAVIDKWNSFLKSDTVLEIPAQTTYIVELSAGEMTCAYPILRMAKGRGSTVKILYAECYGILQPAQITPRGSRPMPPVKGDRTDYKNGVLQGPEDVYTACGHGTEEEPEVYEPYLFRTFRYVRLEIKTEEEPLWLLKYSFRTTGYPLAVKHHPVSDNGTYNQIWDISLRTLKRCMHETYMDCPFYEQLQYAMDSRAEILFTYEVAEDDRLARACMEAFRKSRRADGMIRACAPAEGINVIPGFSIFYILMVHDHMCYFHDRELVRQHLNCIDGILEYFDRHLSPKGLVGSVGGVLFQHKYWSFIDWCPEWDATIGTPTAAAMGDGSITMESLLYLNGLTKAAELAAFAGREGLAREYTTRAETLAAAIKKYCTDEEGLIQDGPGLSVYSTHCQVWAILNDLVTEEQGRKNLACTYRQEGIPQCSVSMSFYLMLAMDKVGVLRENDSIWDMWRKMLENNMTTCVENFTDQRSDCHAWGAMMLYALPRFYPAAAL